MNFNLVGRLNRFHRPYVKDASELTKGLYSEYSRYVNVEKLMEKSKLNNSIAHKANWEFWKILVEEVEFPKYGERISNDNKVQRYCSCLLIGLFHYEYLIDSKNFTNEMIHNAAFSYASELLLPKEEIKKCINKKMPIKEISNIYQAPEECVDFMIKKILSEK